MNANNLSNAQEIIESLNGTKANVKYIKKERGLMERQECGEKVILTEDNRQILLG